MQVSKGSIYSDLTEILMLNPEDHPHGGGRGKTKGNNIPVSPWGTPVSFHESWYYQRILTFYRQNLDTRLATSAILTSTWSPIESAIRASGVRSHEQIHSCIPSSLIVLLDARVSRWLALKNGL